MSIIKKEKKTTKTKVSVIIPTLNGGLWLKKIFTSLRSQSLVPDEILIIDSGSTDDTCAIARSSGVKITGIASDSFDHGGTRSLAGKEATGEILIYMTQDALPADHHALKNLVAPFTNERVAATYGRQFPNTDATPFAAHLRLFNYPARSAVRCWEDREKYGFRTAFISNSFAAYRRSALAEVGFFEDGLLFGEDTFTLAKLLRTGYCVAYTADAGVLHSHNYTVMQEFRRYFDIGVVHAGHNEFVESFGTPSAAGRNFVGSELAYLLEEKEFVLLPVSIVRNGMKYIAYILGKRYRMLPRALSVWLSLNRRWWTAQLNKGT